ncbi:hypothetical protein F5890DRAFT_1409224, partial [Lentinula detonsa]
PALAHPLYSKYILVAVSDTKPESAQAGAVKVFTHACEHTTNVVVRAYHGSAEHAALNKDVSMVAVATKPMHQTDAAMKVIETGKYIFIEWPAGKNINETKDIYDAATPARDKGIETIVG